LLVFSIDAESAGLKRRQRVERGEVWLEGESY
jgi:hypothetical protein